MNARAQVLRFNLKNIGWIALVIVAATGLFMWTGTRNTSRPLVQTVADVQPVHAGVSLGDQAIRRVRRITDGSNVQTDDDGRARIQLDDGTSLIVAGNTRLGLSSSRVRLERGRIFAKGGPDAKTQIDLGGPGPGGPVAILAGSNAALSRDGGVAAKVYAASGEVTLRVGGRDVLVHSGESATVSGNDVKVAPERVFNDWTGGLAAPWGACGRPSRVVGELWGRPLSAHAGDAGSPLTIRAQEVKAEIIGETARTQVKSTFFHAGSVAVLGDFRMALPEGAIVSGFAAGNGENVAEAKLGVASRTETTNAPGSPLLEWAGEGWVRGSIPSISPGAIVSVVVTYVEWLHPQPVAGGTDLVVQYRYPLMAAATPPLVGEFLARIDASASNPKFISAGQGAVVHGGVVELRKSDFRPSADIVVEVQAPAFRSGGRMYVVAPESGDEGGQFVLVRAQSPDADRSEGVAVALVLDTSSSIEPALLDAERGFAEALVGSLAKRDKIIVLGASDGVRPIGPDKMGPADESRRAAILQALAAVRPAGATDLGRALESAADALDPSVAGAMVVYVGDGWPTMGDLRTDAIRARLARRALGMPRLGAVAAGPVANKFGLTALVRGSGPILEIGDRADASAAATALIASALQPAVAGVELAFGSEVEQVYPTGPRAVAAGQTVMAVGRARGDLPKQVVLKWRDAKGAHEQRLDVARERMASIDDVRRRWAASRVEEIAVERRGREAATDVAVRMHLLTPWTAWGVSLGEGGTYLPRPLESRVLDLATGSDAVLSAAIGTPGSWGSSMLDLVGEEQEPAVKQDEGALKNSIRLAAERVIGEASDSIRACRDTRAALRPDLAGVVNIKFDLDGDGRAANVRVSGSSTAHDEALNRCIAQVVQGLPLPAAGNAAAVDVAYNVDLLAGGGSEKAKCSDTSTLPTALRRGVWLDRLREQPAATVYLQARRSCELQTWTDRRALLELMLLVTAGGEDNPKTRAQARVKVASELDRAGENEAAAFLRRETMRRAHGALEIRAAREALLSMESYPRVAFEKQYADAQDNDARLKVVRRFLALAPHDIQLRQRLIALLLDKGDKSALQQEIIHIRSDPFADAALLASCASSLRKLGSEDDARNAYVEIIERAPADPWARAFAGDRLRNEGWYGDAIRVYAPLERLMEGEQGVVLRMALAEQGAGRIDLASRMLTRLTQMPGRSERQQLGELAVDIAAWMLSQPRAVDPAQGKELARRLIELPLRKAGKTILLRTPAAAAPIEAVLIRGPRDAREQRAPDIAARGVGFYRLLLDAGDDDVVLQMSAARELSPCEPMLVQIISIESKGPGQAPVVKSSEVKLASDGKPLRVRWQDGWKQEG
jgi:hypothetical protein